MHFCGINTARACIGRAPLWDPPEPTVFGPNPVGALTITQDENGLRLLLAVTAPVTEDVMVFGQAPCSAGRTKRRNVAYLGLLPAPMDGQSDITALYIARYGEPRPGERIFIVTRQQHNGWEGLDHETNDLVPSSPLEQSALTTPALSLQPYMYKGCTRDAQGSNTPAAPGSKATAKLETTSSQAPREPLDQTDPSDPPDPSDPQSSGAGSATLG